jgi:hypothetical protein
MAQLKEEVYMLCQEVTSVQAQCNDFMDVEDAYDPRDYRHQLEQVIGHVDKLE